MTDWSRDLGDHGGGAVVPWLRHRPLRRERGARRKRAVCCRAWTSSWKVRHECPSRSVGEGCSEVVCWGRAESHTLLAFPRQHAYAYARSLGSPHLPRKHAMLPFRCALLVVASQMTSVSTSPCDECECVCVRGVLLFQQSTIVSCPRQRTAPPTAHAHHHTHLPPCLCLRHAPLHLLDRHHVASADDLFFACGVQCAGGVDGAEKSIVVHCGV
jgi:hypothetical protein